MKEIITFSLLVMLISMTPSTLFAQNEVKQPTITLPAELDRILKDYEFAWQAGDEEALASLFVDDGYVSGETGWLKGQDQIRGKYKNAQGDLKLRAIAYAVEGTTGYILGAYGYGKDDSFTDRGIFVLTIQQATSGKWLIVADLDRSNG